MAEFKFDFFPPGTFLRLLLTVIVAALLLLGTGIAIGRYL